MTSTTREKSDPKNSERPSEPIAIIKKGKTVDVRVGLSEFSGRTGELRCRRAVKLGAGLRSRQGGAKGGLKRRHPQQAAAPVYDVIGNASAGAFGTLC